MFYSVFSKINSVKTLYRIFSNVFYSTLLTLSLFSWILLVLFSPRKDMRSHSPSQQQQCVLGEDRCCLHHHLQPSYRCQPDQTFVVEFYHSKAEGDDRIRSGQGRGVIFTLAQGFQNLRKIGCKNLCQM